MKRYLTVNDLPFKPKFRLDGRPSFPAEQQVVFSIVFINRAPLCPVKFIWCPSTVSLRALVSFRSRNVQFSASSRKSVELRGGALVYAAQAIPPIDAEIAGKGHL
jgi:hypothetical protein